ncbi:hypothetical protein FQA47_005298 [Oryzias melastigma]|uniref:Secreted peptide n=1 Tax=Oryzias melastigma TaxID=30732 RepID=A0A834CGF8_ORYME|nr:hypothetical protein FQA47_005298 [Oryzias melastigma]
MPGWLVSSAGVCCPHLGLRVFVPVSLFIFCFGLDEHIVPPGEGVEPYVSCSPALFTPPPSALIGFLFYCGWIVAL